MIDLKVLGLTLDSATKAPILVLKAAGSEAILPLWIGGVEAMSISLALSEAKAERPLTHDLMADVLQSIGVTLVGMSIVEQRDGIFYGMLDLLHGTRMLQIDCRPSDGIALALRLQAPIRTTEAVLEQAPRERYMAAATGQAPIPDETGEIVLRSLQQAQSIITTSPRLGDANKQAREAEAKTVRLPTSGIDITLPDQPAGAGTDQDDSFAKLLRELEPASKHRM